MIDLSKIKGFHLPLFELSIFVVIMIVFIAAICSVNNEKFTDKSTSLLEAYHIAYHEALNYYDTPALYDMTSTDGPGSTPVDGNNGKRRYWNTIFVDPNSSDRILLISIRDKKAKTWKEIQEPIDKTQIIDMNTLTLTSERAVSIAIADYGLLPGRNWARGYHFVLRSFDGEIDFQVVGLNEDNKRMRVAFDGSNGALLKVLLSGGDDNPPPE